MAPITTTDGYYPDPSNEDTETQRGISYLINESKMYSSIHLPEGDIMTMTLFGDGASEKRNEAVI